MRAERQSLIGSRKSDGSGFSELAHDDRKMAENSSDSHFVVSKQANDDFAIEAFNDAFARSLGRRGGIERGKLVHHALSQSIAKAVVDQLRRCAATQYTVQFQISIRRDRRSSPWEFALVPLRAGPQGSSHIVGRAREILTRSKQDDSPGLDGHMLERLAATSHDILYVVDLIDRKFVYVNQRVQAILGYNSSEMQGRELPLFSGLVHPADLAIFKEHLILLAGLSDTGIRSVEYRVRGADGHYVWLRCSDAVFLRTSKGAVKQTIGSAIDVSDNRHLLEDLKRISSRLLETQNQERRRIARELHDSTAQLLVAVSVGLARLDYLIRRDCGALNGGTEMAGVLKELRDVSSQAQQEIRTLSYLLHPPILESMGLAEALRKFVAGFARRTGIRTRLAVAEAFSCGSHGVSTALMRIAQEALINVFRHAKATEVRVSLANRGRRTILEVTDNGRGMATDESATGGDAAAFGVGIPGMHARVQQFRGELQISSNAAGTTICASIPERAASLVHSVN